MTAELTGKTRCLIVRERSRAVVGSSGRAARERCAVEVQGGQAQPVDPGSRGGTFVSGQRTHRHTLRVNAVVVIGDVTLRFSVQELVGRPRCG